ncbi:MAG: hypothetical protein WC272_07205 [Sulfurimonas sp.]|jgi:uncharacterized membrane-anchored protein
MKHPIVNRVPQIILIYWVIKIASTTLGETGADMFSMTFDLGYGTTIAIFLALFGILVTLKISIARYETFLYWATFTASAIAGTAVSDFIDRTLHLGYLGGSALLITLLLITLFVWYKKEKSIDVDFISTKSSEMYYWSAFLIANTLGTALGDFLADDLNIGFAYSAMIIGSILVAIVVTHYYTKVSSVVLFWLAFVLTRPFGATFGDFLTKDTAHGGIGVGTLYSSLFFFVVMIVALFVEHRSIARGTK